MDFSRISKLDKLTIDKIAAGEVIERPASVLKELVENSLDAGASQINVFSEQGGKSQLKVTDNGKGIHREDLSLLWERHATSKISRAEDLFLISSMGFRGEALSSIAAVSDVEVESKRSEEDVGFHAEISAGRQSDVTDSSRTGGTTILVKNLFSHFPVRKKFLSSDRSEAQLNLKTLIRISLAFPQVGFQLVEGGKTVFDSPSGSLEDRVSDVFGKIMGSELIEVKQSLPGFDISGFVSPPEGFRGTRQSQYFYVNGRNIQSLMLSKAFSQGYDVQIPGKYPAGAIFLKLKPGEIDVNIHPTKKEVKFQNEKYVFSSVSNAIRKGLQKAFSLPDLNIDKHQNRETESREGLSESPKKFLFTPHEKMSLQPEAMNAMEPQTKMRLEDANINSHKKSTIIEWPGGSTKQPSQEEQKWDKVPDPAGQERIETHNVPFLQIHNSYILFEVESGLMVVNQQFAHERILYEQALSVLKSGSKLGSQQLLFPELLDLSFEEYKAVFPQLKELRKLGFDIEEFGGNTFQLRGIPFEISQKNALQITKNIIQRIAEEREESRVELSFLAKAFSGGAKIKMGDKLSSSEISSLIDKLFATQNPFVSPTGKSVVVKYRMEEFNRRFGAQQ